MHRLAGGFKTARNAAGPEASRCRERKSAGPEAQGRPGGSRCEAAFAPTACAACLIIEEAKAASHDWGFGQVRARYAVSQAQLPGFPCLDQATPIHPSPRPMLRRHRVSGGNGRSMAEAIGGGDNFSQDGSAPPPNLPLKGEESLR